MKISTLLLLLFCASMLCAAPRLQKKLQLPETVYAVPGIECNIYFENIFLTINPANFAFEVKCAKGRCDEKRWRFTPKKEDTGTYDLKVRVSDDDGVVAEKSLKLQVIPADAGKGTALSLLLVGSSNIAHQHSFPLHIHSLFQMPGNPALKMIGENGPAGNKAVRHEGYGGWTYKLFISAGRKRIKGRGSNHRENPFWNFKTSSLDFPAYFQKNNSGKAPDLIIVSLGGNDTFVWDDTNISQALEEIRERIRIFVTALRKAAPDAVIGLNQMEYCSKSQDAFGKNYGTLQTRWQTRKNLFKYRNMVEEFVKSSGDKNLFAIPIYIAIDNENNVVRQKEFANARNKTRVFRDANGLHPLPAGYQQTADYVYAWMKYILSLKK